MSPGTARTMMRSQRLGKYGSGVRRNGLLEEVPLARCSVLILNGRLFGSGTTWRRGVFAVIGELRSHLITEDR